MCPRNVKHFFAAANGRAAVAPRGCGIAFFACHPEEFSWVCGAPEAMKSASLFARKRGPIVGPGTSWIPAFAGKTRPSSRGGSRTAPPSPIRVNDIEGAIFGGAAGLRLPKGFGPQAGDEESLNVLKTHQSEIPRCARKDQGRSFTGARSGRHEGRRCFQIRALPIGG